MTIKQNFFKFESDGLKYIISVMEQPLSDYVQNGTFHCNDFEGDVLEAIEISADSPTKRIRIELLDHNLDYEVWGDEKVKIIPRQVLWDQSSPFHDRIEAADLSYPILVYKASGKIFVIDGMHRLSKAYKLDLPYIDAKYVDVSSFIERRRSTYPHLDVQEPWMGMIVHSGKRIEARTGPISKYIGLVDQNVIIGHLISGLLAVVSAVRHYETFIEYLDAEGWINVAPVAKSKNEAIDAYMKIASDGVCVYSDENIIAKGGVVAIEFVI